MGGGSDLKKPEVSFHGEVLSSRNHSIETAGARNSFRGNARPQPAVAHDHAVGTSRHFALLLHGFGQDLSRGIFPSPQSSPLGRGGTLVTPVLNTEASWEISASGAFPLLGAVGYPQIRAEGPGQNEGNRQPRGTVERVGSRQSGAEDTALQTLARKTRRPLGRASVWSVRVFTAAFPTRPTPVPRANACPTVTIPWRFLNEPSIFVGNGQPWGEGGVRGNEAGGFEHGARVPDRVETLR